MAINVQGIEVFVQDVGAGDPILFLHGNPDTSEIWSDVIPHLKDHFRCIAIDLPGFGQSVAPASFDCSFENLGRFLDQLIEELEIRQPLNIVAHDFGGAFAMAWVSKHSQKVSRMVAINHPFFIADYKWHFLARIWRTPLLGELSTVTVSWWPVFYGSLRLGSRNLSKEKMRLSFEQMTPGMKRMVLSLYRAADPDEFKKWEPAMLEATRRVPTMVLWGEHDPYVPSWVAEKFGTTNVKKFNESGHWLPAEAPERVAEELLGFFTPSEAAQQIVARDV